MIIPEIRYARTKKLLDNYNNRFTKKSNKDDGYVWVYDTLRDKFAVKISNYTTNEIEYQLDKYLIDERDNKINEILNENT